MSTSLLVAESGSLSWTQRLSAYLELTKPRIATLVLVVVAASAWVATRGHLSLATLLHTLWGTLFVAASACAANQWMEIARDRLMPRTAKRPLVQDRLTSWEAIAFTMFTLSLGLGWLVAFVNPVTAGIGLLTWMLYVCVYTPLKTVTAWNTFVGAIPGALPVLIGWTCVQGEWGLHAAAIFGLVFLWQFPHFMAIAWLYRHQYERAGFRMLPNVDRSGHWTGIKAVICAAMLLPVSVLPAMFMPGWGGVWYAFVATALGLVQLACAVAFAMQANDVSARRLLWMSLFYLPLVFLSLVVFPGA
jgi:heme o synthase